MLWKHDPICYIMAAGQLWHQSSHEQDNDSVLTRWGTRNYTNPFANSLCQAHVKYMQYVDRRPYIY